MKSKTFAEMRGNRDTFEGHEQWRNAIRDARDGHFAGMSKLADAAKSSGRGLLADEQRAYDKHEVELRGLGKLYEDSAIDYGSIINAGMGGPRFDDGGGGEYRAGEPLRRGQSFEGFVRARGLAAGDDQVDDDRGRLSLRKSLKGIVTGDWRDAEPERRAMSEGVLASGGFMVPTILSAQLVDLARNQTRVIQAGAKVVPMANKTVNVAKWVTDPAAAWHTENAAITPSDATIGTVQLDAKALAGITVVSRELLEDADNVEEELRQAFAAQFSLKVDAAALYGTGTAPEPRGVKNTTGITTVALGGVNGSTPANYDFLADAIGTLADNNETANAAILSPRSARTLGKLKDTTGQPLMRPSYLDGLPMFVTNQIGTTFTVGTSTDTSDVFVADWSQLFVGVRTELQIGVLTERYADNGQIGFVSWWRGDVVVARAKAFHVTTGVRP